MKTCIAVILLMLVGVAHADGLDEAIRAEMAREQIPGLTFAVVRHGEIVREGAYGYADLEWNARTTLDTRFEVASVSKMIAGAAVRILIEEGKVSPEDPVGKFFGDLPPAWAGMKIRHLYTMSSGLPEDFGAQQIPYDRDVVFPDDDASTLKEFKSLKRVAPVGERFSYSSPNFQMLGMIVARVSGMPYAEFVRKRIFAPAGMSDSSIIDNSAVVPHKAQGYRKDHGVLKHGWFLGRYLHSRADDAVLSTARDYAKFVIALQMGRIVRDPGALWQATVSDAGRPLDYSYGWDTDTWLGHRRQGHSGGYRTGFHTYVARYPDDDLSVIVFTNCDFSQIRDYVGLLTRAYLTDVPDPAQESSRADADPAETRHLAGVLAGLAHGKLDESAMEANAVEPVGIAEVQDFLQHAGAFSFAGRRTMGGAGLHMHGLDLVDYETLKTTIDGEIHYLTLYREKNGKVGYIELTN